jgi:glycosyltransferase involved in cell wall biosynthesis
LENAIGADAGRRVDDLRSPAVAPPARSKPHGAREAIKARHLVDVVITCHNEGDFIGDAIKSVLLQTAVDRISSIVVVDSGSDERTQAILTALAGWDPRIRILRRPPSRLAANRNYAVSRSRGEYIAFLDADDAWEDTKLAKQLEILDNEKDFGLVYTGYYPFNGEISKEFRCFVRDLSAKKDLARSYFLHDPPIYPSSILIRRALYQNLNGFDESVEVFEDTEFFLRAARVCRFKGLSQPLFFKRYHGASITANRNELMAHHAFVAFRASALNERLLNLAPRRLSDRARKLANVHYYVGDLREARRMYALAVELAPLSFLAWCGLALVVLGGPAARSLLRPVISQRTAIFGSSDAAKRPPAWSPSPTDESHELEG